MLSAPALREFLIPLHLALTPDCIRPLNQRSVLRSLPYPISERHRTGVPAWPESKLSEHRYILRRRLHCWDVGAGVGWDNSDFEVMLMARLVAFPKVRINVDF